MNSRWFLPLGLVGIICIAIGIYLLVRKPELKATSVSDPSLHETSSPNSQIEVPMSIPWTNTNIQVQAGQRLVITASGRGVWKNIQSSNPNAYPKPYEETGPDGTPPTDSQDYYLNISSYQSRDAYKGALIGRIGEHGLPFKVGSNLDRIIDQSGILYLGINDMKREVDKTAWDDNAGAFTASIKIIEPTTSSGKTIVVKGTDNWKGTGISVKPGQKITVNASGAVVWDKDYPAVGPNGTFPAITLEQPNDFPLPSAGCGSLLMRIGTTIYEVGASKTITANESGEIQLMVNDRYKYLSNNSGSFQVNVNVQGDTPQLTKDQNEWKVVSQGKVPVTQPWTYVGSFKGQVLISISGQAILDPKKGLLSPQGIDVAAPPSFSLPYAPAFCALAKFDNQIKQVGSSEEFYFSSETKLYLGPNDELSQVEGPGFDDNSGAWNYRISSK